jgi:hypothetical protein
MAYDLIFGRTKRNWSCGAHPASTDPTGVVTQAQVDELAKTTNGEIVKSTNLAIKLSRSKRMPEAEKEPFKRFHKKWLSFTGSRRDGCRIEDALALWNFRKLNERFKARFDVLARVAATPIRKPAGEGSAETTALVPKISAWTWALPLWAGIAIAGLSWLGGNSKKAINAGRTS